MQPGVLQREPVAFLGDRLAVQQPRDRIDRFLQQIAHLGRVDAQHMRIGWQRSRAHAKHQPATRDMIQIADAFRHHIGMVIRRRHHPGAKADVARALRSSGYEQFRAAVNFPAAGMMFANPRLVITKVVEQLHQFKIAVDRECRVFVGRMHRWHEHTEPDPWTRRMPNCSRLCHFTLSHMIFIVDAPRVLSRKACQTGVAPFRSMKTTRFWSADIRGWPRRRFRGPARCSCIRQTATYS